jgi:predicted nucleic acid-binding protein
VSVRVLDAWGLMAFFKGEPAADEVGDILRTAAEGHARLLLCVVNWGEVYYGMMRAGGQGAADAAANDLAHMPIELVPVENDLSLVRQAAVYKAAGGISYADAFAAALAKLRKAELVTGDAEFKGLAKEINIHWLT